MSWQKHLSKSRNFNMVPLVILEIAHWVICAGFTRKTREDNNRLDEDIRGLVLITGACVRGYAVQYNESIRSTDCNIRIITGLDI